MATANPIFFTRHDGGVTLYIDHKPYTVSSTVPQFPKLLEALKNREWPKVKGLMSIGNTITSLGKSKKKILEGMSVFVENGKVFYKGKDDKVVELHGTITDRIIKILGKPQAEKFANALLMFIHNAMQNPYKDIRNEIYDFLAAGDQPITYDGCFLAYKKVKADYKSIHGGVIDNTPGKIVRETVFDTDRSNECSSGLHFAAFGYLSSYSSTTGNKVIIVKVNPKDVVAIPRDYRFQKGRTCEYFVVGEYKPGAELKEAFVDTFIEESTKNVSAPSIQFVQSLRPSLEARADSVGLLVKTDVFTKGGIYVVHDTKDNMIPVVYNGKKLFDLAGDEWILQNTDKPELKSILTKSVRVALKSALEKAGK